MNQSLKLILGLLLTISALAQPNHFYGTGNVATRGTDNFAAGNNNQFQGYRNYAQGNQNSFKGNNNAVNGN